MDASSQLGPASIQLNTEALGNFRFSVGALKARMRDGTLIEVPEDGPLPELDLKPALESNRKVTIFLGVPLLKSSHPNIAAEGPSESARYYLITQQLDDENLGVNPQPITIRRVNLRLLLSTQDLAGYETIPLARIQKSDRAEATPQLDTSYIPPVLACDAWRELSVGILQHIYDLMGRKIETLTGQAVSRGISLDNLDSLSQKGVLNFAQLRVFNEAYAYLSNLAFVEGIHPAARLSGAVPLSRPTVDFPCIAAAAGPPSLQSRRPRRHASFGSECSWTSELTRSRRPIMRNGNSSVAAARGCKSPSSPHGLIAPYRCT